MGEFEKGFSQEMESKLMTIGQMSKVSGVHIKSLRYYDRIGVLKPAYTNPETGYRYYTVPQLCTLEAIQLCIELDIPLKEFSRFTGDDLHLHYGELVAYGSEIIKQRMASIEKSMEVIKASQREMELIEQYKNETGVFEREFEEMAIALIPVSSGEEEDARFFQHLGDAYAALEASGLKLGYAYGTLYDFTPGGVAQYSFVQITDRPEGPNEHLRILPAGKRLCKWSYEKAIENMEAIFPDAFAQGGVVTAVESELMSSDQDIYHPLIELSIFISKTP